MNYISIIKEVLIYIDDNINDELNADILASVAGFSTYHFCRMFQWHVGYSVMEYVRIRRLAYAVSDLSSGRKLIDIALDYGFETHSGFSKAFKRYYGVSPEMYRKHARTDKPHLPDIIRMNEYQIGGIVMNPKMVTLNSIEIAGYALKTKNVDGENSKAIPAFWNAYVHDGRMERLHGASFVADHSEYGACLPENPESGEFIYVIGVRVKNGTTVPQEFYTCTLPSATYAVFSTPPSTEEKFVQSIQGTWHYIMNDWFPSSGYEYAAGCVDYELYDERCMGLTNKICDIYIPVTKKDKK